MELTNIPSKQTEKSTVNLDPRLLGTYTRRWLGKWSPSPRWTPCAAGAPREHVLAACAPAPPPTPPTNPLATLGPRDEHPAAQSIPHEWTRKRPCRRPGKERRLQTGSCAPGPQRGLSPQTTVPMPPSFFPAQSGPHEDCRDREARAQDGGSGTEGPLGQCKEEPRSVSQAGSALPSSSPAKLLCSTSARKPPVAI